jgi:LmbE family N-acetylglucosaminyl deacetylase
VKVLALSPHTDDIELGCGGYLSKLHEQGHEIICLVFSDCSSEWGHLPLRSECAKSLSYISSKIHIGDYQVRKFDRQLILDSMIDFRDEFSPDLVLMPSEADVHQDHRIVYEEGVRAFSRDCNVLSYELVWNCRGFKPSFYVELQEKHLKEKLDMLSCYKSQIELHRPYFDEELIRGFARTRGLQIKKLFAESFEVITWKS